MLQLGVAAAVELYTQLHNVGFMKWNLLHDEVRAGKFALVRASPVVANVEQPRRGRGARREPDTAFRMMASRGARAPWR